MEQQHVLTGHITLCHIQIYIPQQYVSLRRIDLIRFSYTLTIMSLLCWRSHTQYHGSDEINFQFSSGNHLRLDL